LFLTPKNGLILPLVQKRGKIIKLDTFIMADRSDYTSTPAFPELGDGKHSVVVGVFADCGQNFIGVDTDGAQFPVFATRQQR
jgi:hypothetical protein